MITFLRYVGAFLGTVIVFVAGVYAVMNENEDDKDDQKKDTTEISEPRLRK